MSTLHYESNIKSHIFFLLALVLAPITLYVSLHDALYFTIILYIIIAIAEILFSGFSLMLLITGIFLFLKDFVYISIKIGDIDIYITEFVIALCLLRWMADIISKRKRAEIKRFWIFLPYLVLGVVLVIIGFSSCGIIAIRHSAIVYYAIVALIVASMVSTDEKLNTIALYIFFLSLAGQIIIIMGSFFDFPLEYLGDAGININIISVALFYYLKAKHEILRSFIGHLLLIIPFIHALIHPKSSLFLAYIVIIIFSVLMWFVVKKKGGTSRNLQFGQVYKTFIMMMIAVAFHVVLETPGIKRLPSEIHAFLCPTRNYQAEEEEQLSILTKGQQNNAMWRLIVWREALTKGLENPLFGMGFGPDFTADELKEYNFTWSPQIDPHNSFLAIFMRTGFVGIICFLLILIPIMTAVVVQSRYLSPKNRSSNIYLTAAWLGLVTIAILNVVLENAYGAVPFWVLVGLIISSVNINLKKYSRLLFVGPLPPPVHGVSIPNQRIIESHLQQEFNIKTIETSHKKDISKLGTKSPKTLVWNIYDAVRIFCSASTGIYSTCYIQISQATIPLIRDAIYIAIARLGGMRIIIHLHGAGFKSFRDNSKRTIKRLIDSVSSSASRFVLEEAIFEQVPEIVDTELIRVVENGVDSKTFTLSDDRKRGKVVYLSNLTHTKGALHLAKSMESVVKEVPATEFVFAGGAKNSDYIKKIRNEIEKVRPPASAAYIGPIYGVDKIKLLQSSEVFVLPSQWAGEGQPFVIIEAMAAGLAIVTSPQGAIPMMLPPIQQEFIVDPEDHNALANAIIKLLKDQELRDRIAKANRETFLKRFTLEAFLEKIGAVFEEVRQEALQQK